ncbi:26S proteasome non-ATPase regulatory subunit 8 [Aphelenchoides bicaudatus]|nr:26S proteasome non-ATPase regulatory subunit 8 [Aphelenchoides bicaudatus]
MFMNFVENLFSNAKSVPARKWPFDTTASFLMIFITGLGVLQHHKRKQLSRRKLVSTMPTLEAAHKALLDEWKSEKNLDGIWKALITLKSELNNPESISALSTDAASAIHKDYFEINALYNVLRGDMSAFEEAISDVHSFYQCQSQESTNKYLMLGLHLMYLIAVNKLSDFHMLLEQVDQSVQQKNPYIMMPVKLEQSLMEGAYNKVTLNEKAIPSPYYAPFIKILMDTVRNDIANCMQKSFKQILLKDATQMLLFDNTAELNQFAKMRGWHLEKDIFHFDLTQNVVDATPKASLDTGRIAMQNLYYAKQLEMIMAETTENSGNANGTTLKIHNDTFIHTHSTLKGRVSFDVGCVVHPHAKIDSGSGEIIFGKYNIVEETAVIENRTGGKMIIGDNNMFEIGSQCAATSIGDNNVLGQKSVVGENVEISNGCVIGPMCQLLQYGPIPERTCIYGSNNERRTMHDAPPPLQMHSKFLCGRLFKFGHAYKNKS